MPGYYDWKIRNCPNGAIAKAQSLLETVDAIEPDLHKIWDENGGSFPEKINTLLASVVEKIDAAEESLEAAKLELATLFPGHPEGA